MDWSREMSQHKALWRCLSVMAEAVVSMQEDGTTLGMPCMQTTRACSHLGAQSGALYCSSFRYGRASAACPMLQQMPGVLRPE